MLYCDNKSKINIAHNPIQHDKTKHIKIDKHFNKKKLECRFACNRFHLSKRWLIC